MKILHLSHTDLNWDYRIVKQLNCLSQLNAEIKGIGIEVNDANAKKAFVDDSINLINIKLFAHKIIS